jgi:hypothetical protein
MRSRMERLIHQVGAGCIEAGVGPFTEGAGDLLLVQLVADARLVAELDQSLVPLLKDLNAILRLTLTLHHLHL